MPFFPMPHYATLLEVILTTDRSGQVTESFNPILTFRCLYNPKVLSREKDRISNPEIQYREIGFLETTPDIPITENNRIQNITNVRDGIIVEAGVFVVETVKNITDLRGRTHHKTCKLLGSSQ